MIFGHYLQKNDIFFCKKKSFDMFFFVFFLLLTCLSFFDMFCGQFVEISTKIANPSLVGCSMVSSLMYTTFVLTRVLDSLTCAVYSCAVHQSALSSELCTCNPTPDLDAHFARMAQDKKRAGHFADRLTCPTPAHGSGACVAATELESETREFGKWCAAS